MSFHVSNGVRQGGILSPILFNVYMDELSIELCKTDIGCDIHRKSPHVSCHGLWPMLKFYYGRTNEVTY